MNKRREGEVKTDAQAASRTLGKAVALHLEGKLKEALTELDHAIETGEGTAEIHSARGHVSRRNRTELG